MSDIIQLLPDAVANQIAAGEVIQRPASVVKELIENAIDSGADNITINIKDSGKTLIQVIDNGKGMSETDARMAFERHATSKIKNAEDLFVINSMGFRGEALASIAAVADIELKTKLRGEELGSYIHIRGSKIHKQETISTPSGSNFSVKNLFFNIPARRKFLKKDSTEFNHIITEFKKTALSRPDLALNLIHNKNIIYKLNIGNLRQRISDIFGKSINKHLVPVENDTSILKISGYVGKPEIAKKRNNEQYFFVNNRFMKHPYFYKALTLAYDQIIRPDFHPTYFIFLTIDPKKIDINIHPAKTEINFDDSQGIFQLLRASIKQSLGKHSIVPSIDFDNEGYIEMPYSGNKNQELISPQITNTPNYNPFEEESTKKTQLNPTYYSKKQKEHENWELLNKSFESSLNQEKNNTEQKTLSPLVQPNSKLFQLKNKYIATPVKSGLMLIHITRAHERILFESLISTISSGNIPMQKLLYPIEIQLTTDDIGYLKYAYKSMNDIGFEINFKKNDCIEIKGVPSYLSQAKPKELIESILTQIKDDESFLKEKAIENICEILSRKISLKYAKPMVPEEMQNIIDKLFFCRMPNFTNNGRKIIEIININEIERLF